MATRGEVLAKEFETKVAEVVALPQKLSDAGTRKSTSGKGWTVGVT